jgi:hypothetical protein
MKVCSGKGGCGLLKPLDEFGDHSRSKSGILRKRSICKSCRAGLSRVKTVRKYYRLRIVASPICKMCSGCKLLKPLEDFSKSTSKALQSRCKHCSAMSGREWVAANPEKRENSILISKYGITLEEKDGLRARSGNRCELCGLAPKTSKSLHIDHDHKTGKVRGLLCSWCNTALGRFHDSPSEVKRWLDKVVKYLGMV